MNNLITNRFMQTFEFFAVWLILVRRHPSTRAEVEVNKPSELYIGVLDLFGVLLPGAVALLEPRIGDLVFGSLVSPPSSEPAQWAAFLLIAYFLGNLIFLLGSYLDPWYNKLRDRVDPYDDKSVYQAATSIRDSILTEQERKPLNTFQWARSVLLVSCPAAAQDTQTGGGLQVLPKLTGRERSRGAGFLHGRPLG